MEISVIDVLIIIFYLITIALIGSFSGGRQRSASDYFMGGRTVPWWAVSFSIVAAETSSLTFISIPGLAYISNLHFLQLTIGYLLARVIIAFVFLPAYRKGNLETAYNFLEQRFGKGTRKYASVTFLFTRVAADGVRLFSTAIPLAIIFHSLSGFDAWNNYEIYLLAISVIALVSFTYTFTGGIKGVIWADVLQMFIYIGGAILALFVLSGNLPDLRPDIAGKAEIFNLDLSRSIGEFFSDPYTLIGSLVGGIFLSLASHGTDQLIVQRLLTTRTLKDSQKAIVVSGVMVMIQFALFLVVGLFLYMFFEGIALTDPQAPFNKADEIFPFFIIHYLPSGIRGIIIAGLFAAAISTLAGSISSLSSSAMLDLYKPLKKGSLSESAELFVSRIFTVFWAVILTGVAVIFINIRQSVVEIALGIASITYGGLLGIFLLGFFFSEVRQKAGMIGFSCGIIVMLALALLPRIGIELIRVHWTWYVLIGTTTTVVCGLVSEYIIGIVGRSGKPEGGT